MLRAERAKATDQDGAFHWRGDQVTRIENLSDIVFALALGMLVSASTVPRTYEDLLGFLWNIVPVTAGFAVMLQIWNQHFLFFRRFALADRTIVLLNAMLLLFVLFFAYPIRFTFDALFAWVLGMAGDYGRMSGMRVNYDRARVILAIYAVGYAMIYTVFGLMYGYASKKADVLALNETERRITRQTWAVCTTMVLLALVVLPVVLFTPLGPIGGFIFVLSWPIRAITERWAGRGRKDIPKAGGTG